MTLNALELFEDIEYKILDILPQDIVTVYRFGLDLWNRIPRSFLFSKAREALRKLKLMGLEVLDDRISVVGSKPSIDTLSLLWEHYLYAEIERTTNRIPPYLKMYIDKLLKDYRIAVKMAIDSKVKSYRLAIAMLRAAAGLCLAQGEQCRYPFINMLRIDIARKIIAELEGIKI